MSPPSGGYLRPYSATLVASASVFDAGILVATFWLAELWLGLSWTSSSTILAATASVVYFFAAWSMNLYRSWRMTTVLVEVGQILGCWVAAAFTTSFVLVLLDPQLSYPRDPLLLSFLIAPLALCMSRFVIRGLLHALRRRGRNYRTACVIGANALGRRLTESIAQSPWMGLRVQGIYDDRRGGNSDRVAVASEEIQGTSTELLVLARKREFDIVYITLPMRAELRIREMLDAFCNTTVSAYYVPDVNTLNVLKSRWVQIGEIPAISLTESPIFGHSAVVKRLEDLVLATAALVVAAIPMLLISICIKLSSPGPVIFRQRRYGLDGQEFEIWKFRTMRNDAGKDHPRQARRNDVRIYPFGQFLRRSSLDELPQFFNVLSGSMSVVGPRPHPLPLDDEHRRLIQRYSLRHKVKPGITGLAQIKGLRGETKTLDNMQRRLESDLEYIKNWSLILDAKIVLLTFRSLRHPNAY